MLKKVFVGVFAAILLVVSVFSVTSAISNIDLLFSNGSTSTTILESDNWTKKKNITVDHNLVTSDLTDFPLLLNFTDTDLRDDALDNGFDIRFTLSDGLTQLSHEIEFFNGSTGELTVWVKVNLSSSVDTVLFMYYNYSDSGDQQDSENVWDENFTGVYHLNNDTIGVDSTSFNNDGVTQGSPVVELAAVRYGTEFDGSDDLINFSDVECFISNQSFSIEFWVNISSAVSNYDRLFIQNGCNQGNVLILYFNDGLEFLIEDGDGDPQVATPALNDNQWYHVVWIFDGSIHTIMLDGINQTSSPDSNTIDFSGTSYLASRDGGNLFPGVIDEFRLTNFTRSFDWFNSTYLNQNDPNSFYSVGSEENITGDNITMLVYKTVFDEGENLFGFINLTWLSNGSSIGSDNAVCNMSFYGGVEEQIAVSNGTICNSGCDNNFLREEFTFTDDNTSEIVTEDFMHISVCHSSNAIRDLDVTVECGVLSDNFEIDRAEIPLCSAGFVVITLNLSDVCFNSLSKNVTLDNSAPNPSQSHMIEWWEIDREFEIHIEENGTELIYNETLGLWHTNHIVEYYKHGLKNITGNCTGLTNSLIDNSVLENIRIVNIAPTIFFSQINYVNGLFNLSDDMIMEYGIGEWEWIVSVVDDDISEWNFTIYCDDNIVFNRTLFVPQSVNTTNGLFVDFINPTNSTCSLNISVVDTFGNSTIDSMIFTVIDSNGPECFGFENETSWTFGTYYNWTSFDYCVDDNFFSLNITCNNSFSSYTDGINAFSYSPDGEGFNISYRGLVNCSIEACDGHSVELNGGKDFVIKKDLSKREISFDNAKISIDLDVNDITYSKNEYNTSYGVCFELKNSIKNNSFTFYLSDGFVHYPEARFPGYFVNPDSKIWWDSYPYSKNQLIVQGTMITIMDDGLINKSKVCFNSIGKFNCIHFTQTILGGDFVSPEITLLQPQNDSVVTTNQINFSFNVTEPANCSLFINGSFETSILTNGTSNFGIIVLPNGIYEWNVSCSDSESNTGVSEIFFFGVEGVQPLGYFSVGECPVSDTPTSITFVFLVLIALFFIWLGFVNQIGVIGFFGSILLMILSWYIVGCSHIFGIVIGLFSFVLIIWFAFIVPIGFKNDTFK